MKPETFGLQTAVAGGDLPEAWQALIASQESTLAALLSRMQTTAALMCRREAPAERLHALAAEAKRVLTAQAQVRLERELVELRAFVMDLSTKPAAMVERVQRFELVTEVLHANLAAGWKA